MITLVIITDEGGSKGYNGDMPGPQFSQGLLQTMQAPCATLPASIAYLEACTSGLAEAEDGPLSCPEIRPVGLSFEPQTAGLARTLTKLLKDRQDSSMCQPMLLSPDAMTDTNSGTETCEPLERQFEYYNQCLNRNTETGVAELTCPIEAPEGSEVPSDIVRAQTLLAVTRLNKSRNKCGEWATNPLDTLRAQRAETSE